MSTLLVVMVQMNPWVGHIERNADTLLALAWQAYERHGAQCVVFPELCLIGYPPEDLLLRPSLQARIDRALARLAQALPPIAVVVGYPKQTANGLTNTAGLFAEGALQMEYSKQCLPNYQVFDEKRYFVPGKGMPVFQWAGFKLALCICEDIWHPEPAQAAKAAGAEVLLCLNASPFHMGKQAQRQAVVQNRSQQTGLPIVYVNPVGGQDELVFDGQSFAVDANGQLQVCAPAFTEGLTLVRITQQGDVSGEITPPPSDLASIYQALVLGVRDYVQKNHFPSVLLGLSGGIDSALTLAIAVDALGPERVSAVMMPYLYTSSLSQQDAAEQAKRMGVAYQSLSIAPMVQAFTATLAPAFAGKPADTTEENLQARCRGVLLMALSNKTGALVLTTGNKSEMAVGYATLYGDMAGGFDVLKDVAKTRVFALAEYRNQISEVIPKTVISRPPSAELAPDQKDEDSLPPYPVLDAILALYIEQDYSAEAIIAKGFAAQEVLRVLRLVDINEYKRRQAAIGPRITTRGFGRDRRYPITNAWPVGD